jgi:hypothetical protein
VLPARVRLHDHAVGAIDRARIVVQSTGDVRAAREDGARLAHAVAAGLAVPHGAAHAIDDARAELETDDAHEGNDGDGHDRAPLASDGGARRRVRACPHDLDLITSRRVQ